MLNESFCEEDKRFILQMVDGINFVSKNLAVDYDNRGRVVGLFASYLNQMCMLFKGRTKIARRFSVCNRLFAPNGSLHTASVMMHEENNVDRQIYDEVLVRMFIFWDGDWNTLFEQTAGLKDRICRLSNEYCNRCLAFLKEKERATVFLTEDIVQDNSAMLIKEINILKGKMLQYGMHSTVGGVFPIYGI